MFSRLGKRLTYTNVAVTVALIFAMTGGAYAAKKYVITSTKQVSPTVLKALKGKNGAQGPAGPAGSVGPKGEPGLPGGNGQNGGSGPEGPPGPKGASGATGPAGGKGTTGPIGPTGPTGSPWTAGGTLPVGATEKGTWTVLIVENFEHLINGSGPISFGVPLSSAPTVEFVGEGEPGTTNCPGTFEAPTAKSGFLCIYAETNGAATFEEAVPFTAGAIVRFASGTFNGVSADGTWAVTG